MNYSFQREEKEIIKKWKKSNPFLLTFSKDELEKAKLIMMAPPNMTGAVHLGHVWDLAIPDFYNRFYCLENKKASLFIPGKDHAGIATQAKIEQALRAQGVNVENLTFEEKMEVANKWISNFSSQANTTWETFGLSQNNNYHTYTKDEKVEEEINKLFVEYFNQGLIYQGDKIVNWDLGLQTAISNEEVEWRKSVSKLYHVKYRLKGEKNYLIIATTRPETIFSDVAIFVNPKDERYLNLKNKKVINPLNGEEIPILQDKYVELEFGTGVLKCTPQHDINDFLLHKKHKLPLGESSICLKGKLTSKTGDFEGLTIDLGRAKVIEYLVNSKLIEAVEDINNELPFSSRSHSRIEPLISKQWFFKTTTFCKQAFLQFSKKGHFEPAYFADKLEKWGEVLEDWCISRQLWWGTRIPLYSDEEGNYIAALKNPDSKKYKQVEDVFDTWFTSGHWPYLIKHFLGVSKHKVFEISAMGFDIFFFWAVRMILTSYSKEKLPAFNQCLLHGLLRDDKGRKMSKSLDNGVDPLQEVKKESADTIRWALLSRNTYGNDINYSNNLLQEGKALVTKINNAYNFLLIRQEEEDNIEDTSDSIKKEIVNAIRTSVCWLTKELSSLVDKNLINVYCKQLRLFFFNNFCGRYIELMKKYYFTKKELLEIVGLFHKTIKLLSPIMPFFATYMMDKIEKNSNIALNINLRNKEYHVENKIIDLAFSIIDHHKIISKKQEIYQVEFTLKSRKEKLIVDDILSRFIKKSNSSKSNETEEIKVIETFHGEKIIIIFLVKKDLEQKNKKIKHLEKEISRSKGMLSNERFTSKAPKNLVEKEKKKLEKFEEELSLLKNS